MAAGQRLGIGFRIGIAFSYCEGRGRELKNFKKSNNKKTKNQLVPKPALPPQPASQTYSQPVSQTASQQVRQPASQSDSQPASQPDRQTDRQRKTTRLDEGLWGEVLGSFDF